MCRVIHQILIAYGASHGLNLNRQTCLLAPRNAPTLFLTVFFFAAPIYLQIIFKIIARSDFGSTYAGAPEVSIWSWRSKFRQKLLR